MRQLHEGAHQEGLTLRRGHEHPQRLRRSAPPLYRQRGAVTSTVGDSVEHALHGLRYEVPKAGKRQSFGRIGSPQAPLGLYPASSHPGNS